MSHHVAAIFVFFISKIRSCDNARNTHFALIPWSLLLRSFLFSFSTSFLYALAHALVPAVLHLNIIFFFVSHYACMWVAPLVRNSLSLSVGEAQRSLSLFAVFGHVFGSLFLIFSFDLQPKAAIGSSTCTIYRCWVALVLFCTCQLLTLGKFKGISSSFFYML